MTSLDLDRAAETFAEASRLHRRRGGGVLDPRPGHARTGAALRGAARRRGERPAPARAHHRRADLLGDRDHLRRRRRPARRARPPARAPQAPVRARRSAGRRAGRHRHPSVGRLPRAADHRHRALPPRRGGPEIRGLAQQHLQPARAPRRARHRPRGARLRPPAPGAAAAAGDLRQLALPGRPRQRAALGAHAELHQELPALRRPRRVRRLAGLPRVHRVPEADQLDRRVHPGVVVGQAALQLRHRRGAHLRRAGDRAGVRRARRR